MFNDLFTRLDLDSLCEAFKFSQLPNRSDKIFRSLRRIESLQLDDRFPSLSHIEIDWRVAKVADERYLVINGQSEER